jgi:hypothetical protein
VQKDDEGAIPLDRIVDAAPAAGRETLFRIVRVRATPPHGKCLAAIQALREEADDIVSRPSRPPRDADEDHPRDFRRIAAVAGELVDGRQRCGCITVQLAARLRRRVKGGAE